MNPGPAPRPPGQQTTNNKPRLNYTPAVQNVPGNMSAHSLNSVSSINRSQTSLTPLTEVHRTNTSSSGGSFSVVKEGYAMVKEDGVFSSLMFSKRYLILRERRLDFHKASNTQKVVSNVNLNDVTQVTRSEQGTAFEITRFLNGQPPANQIREAPVKTIVCKVDSDEEVYTWIEMIYQRCPNMSGVSNPTNFTHQVHVGFDAKSGGFTGLPPEWERLLNNSAISHEDYRKNPAAVIEVLNFYTEKMQHQPTPNAPKNPTQSFGSVSGSGMQQQYSAGTSIAPPRPSPPTNGLMRQENGGMGHPQAQSPANIRKPTTDSPISPLNAHDYAMDRTEQDRRRREEDLRRERAERERREHERRREDERRRREREEQAAYNASLPQTRQPIAKQEVGGGYGNSRDEPDRWQPARQPPQPPSMRERNETPPGSLRQQQTPPQQRAPQATNGRPADPPKPYAQQQRQQSPSAPRTHVNGSASTRIPVKPNTADQQRPPQSSSSASSSQPKPLNVPIKQPTGPAAVAEAARNLEGDGAAPPRADAKKQEARMSSMSEAEVMKRLREVVSKEAPLASYNKQKKIGQGASGSVYVARVRENAISREARGVLANQGPRAQVAIKQMDLRNQPRKELIVNEIVVMKDSKHPNIVNFIEAFLPEDQMDLWVVMEFMEGGPLTDVIDNNTSIAEDQIATICLEVSLATS